MVIFQDREQIAGGLVGPVLFNIFINDLEKRACTRSEGSTKLLQVVTQHIEGN